MSKARTTATAVACALLLLPTANAAAAASDEGLPSLDRRGLTGNPGGTSIARDDALLTGPSTADPVTIALDYVRDHGERFGLRKGDYANLEVVARSTSPDGITHLRFNQVLDGIQSFDSGIDAHVTDDGRLVTISGRPVPGAKLPSAAPQISATAGLGEARQSSGGEGLSPRVERASRSGARTTEFTTGEQARLLWTATDAGPQLVWQVLSEGAEGQGYESLVDASNGEVLVRRDLTEGAGAARYFRADPDLTPVPTEITMPPAWYDDHDGGTRLWGQFARTYDDPGDADPAPGDEGGRPQVASSNGNASAPDWLFDVTTFPAATPCPTSGCTWDSTIASSKATNFKQAATNVHVLTSLFHDYLQQPPIGFDEASGNFQRTNAGPAGAANDYVRVEVNDGQGVNNANFFTPPDGEAPRMQMYLWTTRDVNGSDAADIVFHEYGHGLSSRLITTASGSNALVYLQPRMMGEAWSDFYANDLLVAEGVKQDQPGIADVTTGVYPIGGIGIRAKPSDCPPNGGGAACNGYDGGTPVTGGYTFGDLGSTLNSSPHNGGEVWGQTLWDIRSSGIPRDDVLALITGGMRLSKDYPTMLDMRDAILQQAVAMRSDVGAADDYYDQLWTIFAARGMGTGASVSGNPDSTTVTEDFAKPTGGIRDRGTRVLDPYPGGDNDGVPEPGEELRIEQRVQGIAAAADLVGVTATLTAGAAATVLDGTAAWPVLGRGRTAANGDPLVVRLDTAAGCQARVPITLQIDSSDNDLTIATGADPRPGAQPEIQLTDGSGTPGAPVPGVTETTFEVPASAGAIGDLDLRIDELRHTWLGDLRIELSHGGRTALIVDQFSNSNFDADDIVEAIFDSESGTPQPSSGPGPVTGRLDTAGTGTANGTGGLEMFTGDDASGTWTLRVIDQYPGDDGRLLRWGLSSAAVPCGQLEIPAAATGGVSAVTPDAATLAGSVTPNGRATGLRFAYGKTAAYGSTTTVQDVGAGDAAADRTAGLTGLEPETTYHFRVEAIREDGQVAVAGEDRTFTTAAKPKTTPGPRSDGGAAPQPPAAGPPPAPLPSAVTPSVSAVKVALGKARTKGRRRPAFSFTLSAPAEVTVTLTRAVRGTRSGSRCGPRKRRGRACTRQVPAGTTKASLTAAGAQKVTFPAAGLRKGSYTATVVARGAGGNGRPVTVRFTVR